MFFAYGKGLLWYATTDLQRFEQHLSTRLLALGIGFLRNRRRRPLFVGGALGLRGRIEIAGLFARLKGRFVEWL